MISGLTNHAFQSGNLMEGLEGVWGKGLSLAVASRMVLWYLSDYIVTSAVWWRGGYRKGMFFRSWTHSLSFSERNS